MITQLRQSIHHLQMAIRFEEDKELQDRMLKILNLMCEVEEVQRKNR